MNKFTYWLRKSGMLRTSSYSVKGGAEKLNKINASDGGMIQSQKDIDQQYKESQNQLDNFTQQDNNQNKKGSNSRILFWIFLVFGILIFLFMFIMDIAMGSFLFLIIWIWFLYNIWKKSGQGILLISQTIAIGLILLIVAFVFTIIIILTKEPIQQNNTNITKIEEKNKENDKEEKNKDAIKKVVKKDKISQFFVDLQEGTGVELGAESMEKVIWTNGGAGLGLQNGKMVKIVNISNKTFKIIKKYFENNNGTHGTVGMVFKGKVNQEGYYFQDGEYKMLMCILTNQKDSITISCGWGPGGNK